MPNAFLDQIQRALTPSLAITRELGGGGMSRVFLAHETALGRDVVVKVLHPDLASGVSVERFNREIQLAARLQHPHIVPIIAAGEIDGLPYFTMPYVAGRSLGKRMTELAGEPMPVPEAISVLRDVARALAFAHSHGVVHRDVKPDNVLLADGAATVTDFGVAKAISAARGDQSERANEPDGPPLTAIGSSIGTPLYMAPEQAVGDPSVDHRADIYSWGVMAYELLAGRPPFEADSPHKLLIAHIMEQPAAITDRRADCPPALATMVMKALAKDPDHRPQFASDLTQSFSDGTGTGSTPTATTNPLGAAQSAFQKRDWATASTQLLAADAIQPLGAADLEMLGEAAIAMGRYDDAQRARERAYAAYNEAKDMPAAARIACALALDHFVRGRLPLSSGWMETAGRAIAGLPETASNGLLLWLKGQVAVVVEGDTERGLGIAEEVIAIGRRVHDLDVEMMGIGTAGRALIRLGGEHVQQGLAYLDTAMVSATSGALRPDTARYVFCNLLCGCHELGDYKRAGEWSDAADKSTARLAVVPAAGDCHVHRATVLRVRGEWDNAEAAAIRGTEELAGEAYHGGVALNELGELRFRRGDYAGAAEAFQGAQERGHSALPGAALLALAQGKSGAAAAMLRAALEDVRSPLLRASLLPAAVDVAVAMKDIDRARTAASELATIAGAYQTPALNAAQTMANGAVALASGDAAAASHLRRAVKQWHELRMPYEGAKARVMLAAAYAAAGDPESETLELSAAKPIFERLGAVVDAERLSRIG